MVNWGRIKVLEYSSFMRRKVIIICCLVAAPAVAFWFFWPAPSYEIQRVDPRLLALQQPFRNVKTIYFMDGGSIGIEIVDRDGRMEQFAIPAYLGDANRYTRVFVGAMHGRKLGTVEIAEPEHTKRMLVCILQDYPNRTVGDDFALMALGRRPVDYARCLIHKLRGNYKE